MNVKSENRPAVDGERERAFQLWDDKRVKEISSDPDIQAQIDEDLQRIATGQKLDGLTLTPDELRDRATRT